MYQVNLGNKILYYPANEEFAIYDTELTEDIGIAGEFTFKVPPTNLLYSELSTGKLITILKDKKEFWRGEIRDITVDFAKIATVYVVEDVAWLGDEFIPPAKITTQTCKQRLDAVIQTYNSTRSVERQFRSGSVYNGTAKCNWKTEYEWSILDSIRKCICRDDYYIKVRRTVESGNTVRYIDIVRLQEYGKSTSQPIEYGYNLLDYVKESDYGNLTNVLTPYGDELEDSEVYDDYSERLQGNTISNAASINTYGRHAKAVVFDGVSNASTLNNLAASYLSRYSQPQLTMEVKAVDLSVIDNIQDIAIGDKVRVIAKPFAVDQELYLTEIVRDLQNVDKNTLTLSGHVTRKTLTNQMMQATDAIEELPSEWDLLKAAKKNALQMLLDETQGGHVVYEYDETNSYIVAINICDQPTIDSSTKRWRWSQNGFGYMERKNTGQSWPKEADVKAAITMDGAIVADFITSGALNAKIITAGILKDKNETFSLNMETGALTMNSGTFKGTLSGATGTFAGSLNAATGSFKGSLNAATGTFSGSLNAATGTLTDGVGTLSLSGGDLHMRNGNSGGPGVFASKTDSPYYSCWGSVNSAAQDSDSAGGYIETSTKNIVQAGIDVSDMRLKEDIKDIDKDFAQALIMGIQPKTFHYKDGNNLPAELQFGVIAQEIQSIEEEYGITEENRLCYEQNDGMLAVQYKQLIAPMIKVIQNLQEQINELKGEKNG